ncbi:MAG: FAD-dependent oxidoreductase [Candidatus Paceibacterota bacterium]|jgi:alkyl hydroperoxide reductase subunit F
MEYELIIIGGGPAGAAAGVYASRKRLKTLLATYDFGGQSVVSEKIENWIGTPAISGADLASSLRKHVEVYAGDILTVKEGEKITSVQKNGGVFEVKTESGNSWSGKTVLIAAGSGRRKLQAKNADLLEHKGLTYCASCDGPLFSDMDVVVVGGGNAAFETASQLLAYCRSVTLLNHSEGFAKADPGTVEKVLSNPKMKAIDNAEVVEVKGEKFVSGLVYKNKKTEETLELAVSGIFVEIGQTPNTGFVKDLVELDQYGRVKIDARTQKSSTPGIWAAGDCSDILYHQNNIAAGDAVKAVEDIYLHLHAK